MHCTYITVCTTHTSSSNSILSSSLLSPRPPHPPPPQQAPSSISYSIVSSYFSSYCLHNTAILILPYYLSFHPLFLILDCIYTYTQHPPSSIFILFAASCPPLPFSWTHPSTPPLHLLLTIHPQFFVLNNSEEATYGREQLAKGIMFTFPVAICHQIQPSYFEIRLFTVDFFRIF